MNVSVFKMAVVGGRTPSTEGFSCLPDEICSMIFSYLHPIDDNLLRLASVCRRWKDIIYNTPSLWQTVSTNPLGSKRLSNALFSRQENEQYELEMALKVVMILRRFGQFIVRLKTKCIREESLKSATIFSVLGQLKYLKAIKIDLPCEGQLLASLSTSSLLEEFSARGVWFRPQERHFTRIPEEILLKFADQFPNLRKLELCDCYLSFESIASALVKLKHLTEIKIKFRLEGGYCNPGVDSAFIRTYRRVEAGKFLTSLAQSEFANKVTVINLEDVLLNGKEIKTFMKCFTALKKFKLETFIEDMFDSTCIDIESNSLEELKLWDVANIRSVNMVLPNLKKLFISDLHLDSLHICAPNLQNLLLGPLRSFDEHLDVFSLETGSMSTLEVTDIGHQNSINIDTLISLLKKNPKLKHLVIEAGFTSNLTLTRELCPSLLELTITGSVTNIRASGDSLQRFEVSGDCIDLDSDTRRTVYLSAKECDLVDVCRMPSLGLIYLDCPRLNLVFISDCAYSFSKPSSLTTIVLSEGTTVQTLSIDNICSFDIRSMGKNKIGRLKVRNCSLKSLLPMEVELRSLEITKCGNLRTLNLSSVSLEEMAITGCSSLESIHLNCPSLWRLKIADDCALTEGENFLALLQEVKSNCPNVEIVHQA